MLIDNRIELRQVVVQRAANHRELLFDDTDLTAAVMAMLGNKQAFATTELMIVDNLPAVKVYSRGALFVMPKPAWSLYMDRDAIYNGCGVILYQDFIHEKSCRQMRSFAGKFLDITSTWNVVRVGRLVKTPNDTKAKVVIKPLTKWLKPAIIAQPSQ